VLSRPSPLHIFLAVEPADVVWRLDRWGRSVADLMTTFRELNDLGVGFVSLTEALDVATATGRAMAGLLAIVAEFEREILRERVRAGMAQARKEGRPHGRPPTASQKADEVLGLKAEQVSHSEIAQRLGHRRGHPGVRRDEVSGLGSVRGCLIRAKCSRTRGARMKEKGHESCRTKRRRRRLWWGRRGSSAGRSRRSSAGGG
jgi:DNA invertase Pin-like site-specific DNA recombinase